MWSCQVRVRPSTGLGRSMTEGPGPPGDPAGRGGTRAVELRLDQQIAGRGGGLGHPDTCWSSLPAGTRRGVAEDRGDDLSPVADDVRHARVAGEPTPTHRAAGRSAPGSRSPSGGAGRFWAGESDGTEESSAVHPQGGQPRPGRRAAFRESLILQKVATPASRSAAKTPTCQRLLKRKLTARPYQRGVCRTMVPSS